LVAVTFFLEDEPAAIGRALDRPPREAVEVAPKVRLEHLRVGIAHCLLAREDEVVGEQGPAAHLDALFVELARVLDLGPHPG
jgi:hypothetical protein